jgi:hypothetical protein
MEWTYCIVSQSLLQSSKTKAPKPKQTVDRYLHSKTPNTARLLHRPLRSMSWWLRPLKTMTTTTIAVSLCLRMMKAVSAPSLPFVTLLTRHSFQVHTIFDYLKPSKPNDKSVVKHMSGWLTLMILATTGSGVDKVQSFATMLFGLKDRECAECHTVGVP